MKKIVSTFMVVAILMILGGCTQTVVEPEFIDWGITFSASDVAPTGLVILCEQVDGEQQGELFIGSYYWLQVYEGEEWVAVEYVPQEYDVGWTEEAWIIAENDTTKWDVDWEWLYGELPSGNYRIGKTVSSLVEVGERVEQSYYATFEIE